MSDSAQSIRLTGLLLTAIVAVDQVTKALVRSSVDIGDENAVFPGLQIVHGLNRGVAFGALAGKPVVMIIVLVALAGLLVWFALHRTQPHVWLPTGMLLGGAIGNIIDRIREGAVTDFLKIPLWPAFNLADVAIVVGVFALLYVLERGDGADEPT